MERIICIQLDFNIDMPVEKKFLFNQKTLAHLWKIISCEFPGHATKWDTLTYVFPGCLTRWELFTKTNKQDNKSILLLFSSLSACTSSRVSLSKDGTYTRSKIDQLLCCWPPRNSKNLWKCQKQHQFIFGIRMRRKCYDNSCFTSPVHLSLLWYGKNTTKDGQGKLL